MRGGGGGGGGNKYALRIAFFHSFRFKLKVVFKINKTIKGIKLSKRNAIRLTVFTDQCPPDDTSFLP